MFQKKDSLLMFLLFLSSFIPLLFSMPYAPSSNTKSFNYTYDCSYLFSETSTCDLLNLTFANEVFSNSFESNLEAINNFIEESYIFKKKFSLRKETNDTSKSDYIMVLSEDLTANDSLSVFFSEDEVLHSKSYGRASMLSFPEVDLHVEYPILDLPDDLGLVLSLLYHLYHISHSKFANDLRLLPREIRHPVYSLSQYEIELLEEDSLAYNATIQFRKYAPPNYQRLSQEIKFKWNRQERLSFLNGRDEIPKQDFVYAWLMVHSKSWVSVFDKVRYFYMPPVFMHLKFAEEFYINRTRIYRFLTGRDKFSTKVINRYDQKENDNLVNDMFDAKTENFLLFHSFIPKRNDYDCINVRVMPEYVAKDWMKGSTGEECFDRVLNSSIINYHIVALHMNMDEEEQVKCEMILNKFKDADIVRKQQIAIRKCPFSGYKVVDLWKKAFQEIDEEQKPELKEKIKKAKEYVKLRKELELDTTNGELIRKLWEGKLSLLEDIKAKMNDYREFSLKKIKASKEAETMSFEQQPFQENKIEL